MPIHPALKIEVVCNDGTLFELVASGGNDSFYGSSRFYASIESGHQLADMFRNFPTAVSDSRELELGSLSGYGGIRLKLFCADGSAHVVLEVTISSDVGINRRGQVDYVLRVDPARIDDFVKQLESWDLAVGNVAELSEAS